MITLKYSTLLDKNFYATVKKVEECKDLCPTTRYRALRIAELVSQGVKQAVKERTDILSKYAKTNENGDFILNESSTDFQWRSDVDREDVVKSVDGFGDKTFEINKHPFFLESLDNMKLAPIELSYLAPLIVFPDVD